MRMSNVDAAWHRHGRPGQPDDGHGRALARRAGGPRAAGRGGPQAPARPYPKPRCGRCPPARRSSSRLRRPGLRPRPPPGGRRRVRGRRRPGRVGQRPARPAPGHDPAALAAAGRLGAATPPAPAPRSWPACTTASPTASRWPACCCRSPTTSRRRRRAGAGRDHRPARPATAGGPPGGRRDARRRRGDRRRRAAARASGRPPARSASLAGRRDRAVAGLRQPRPAPAQRADRGPQGGGVVRPDRPAAGQAARRRARRHGQRRAARRHRRAAHLLAHGDRPHDLRIFVPVDLRPRGEPVPASLGNRFGLVFLRLPVAEPDVVARCTRCTSGWPGSRARRRRRRRSRCSP